MKTATVAELKNDFDRLQKWLEQGEEIQIVQADKHVATLLPPNHTPKKEFELPDFEARLKRIWGDRVFTLEEVEEMRRYEAGEDE